MPEWVLDKDVGGQHHQRHGGERYAEIASINACHGAHRSLKLGQKRKTGGSKPPACKSAVFEDQLAAASFFSISRLMMRAFCESSSPFALARKASRPPRCSTERSALAEMRRRTERLQRVGEQRDVAEVRQELPLGLVVRVADECGHSDTALPVSSQRRDMGSILSSKWHHSFKSNGFASQIPRRRTPEVLGRCEAIGRNRMPRQE